MKKRDVSINLLVDVKEEGYSRNFYYVRDIVCENKGSETTELLSGETFPLVTELPKFKGTGSVVLRGMNKDDYAKARTSDLTMDYFNKVFSCILESLETLDNPIAVRQLYRVISCRDEHIIDKGFERSQK